MTRDEMRNHIDAKAGAVRAKYITVAPGQEATYLLKAEQARQFAAVGFAGAAPGLVMSEAQATGETARQAAERILGEEEAWSNLAAAVEQIRRSGKVAVTQAPSELAATQAFEATITMFAGMLA